MDEEETDINLAQTDIKDPKVIKELIMKELKERSENPKPILQQQNLNKTELINSSPILNKSQPLNKTKLQAGSAHTSQPKRNQINMEAYQAYYNTNENKS